MMSVDEVNAVIRDMSVEDRRKVALYILELEKEHIQNKVGPQITQDLDSLGKALQDAVEKIKKTVKESL